MTVQFITEIIQDGAFAAIAAIGFAIISNPPRKAILISALLAAIGHGLRYFLMHTAMPLEIATASFFRRLLYRPAGYPVCKSHSLPGRSFFIPVFTPYDSGNVCL